MITPRSGRDDSLTSPALAHIILRRIRGAVGKEHLGKTLLQLAWTAGPVTYLALQGGYFIGYGKSAPVQVFIYFAGYTVVAGLFALAIRFMYHLTRGGEKDEDLESLQRVFDLLPDRITEVRDMQLALLDPTGRRVLGAKYLLENPDASAGAVFTAVRDLTGDIKLANLMYDIEIYRRSGLGMRVADVSVAARELLEHHRDALAAVSQETARLVWMRAAGENPVEALGRTRTRGFLGRIISASESDNLNLMSLGDAEEICVLVFELICGRRFPAIQIHYSGSRSYTEAAAQLSRTRREYRAAIYARNSRIRVLAERLYNLQIPGEKKRLEDAGSGIRNVLASLPQVRSAGLLQELIAGSLFALLKNGKDQNLRPLIELYRRLIRAGQRVEKSYRIFRKSWEVYSELMRQRGSEPVRLCKPGEKHGGIRLHLKYLSLANTDALPAARLIEEKLYEFTLQHEVANVKINDQKELAVVLLQIIERFFPLGEPRIQQAIENTNSAYLVDRENIRGRISGNRWNPSLVASRQGSLRGTIHETLRSLVEYEQLELRPEDFEYLVREFDADPEYLKGVIPAGKTSLQSGFDVPEPVPVKPLPRFFK